MTLSISKNILFVQSFFTALTSTVYATSFVDFSGGGGKNKLRLLARKHADALAEKAEDPRPAICSFLYEKTPIDIWNGFNVIDEISPGAKYVITNVGYSMPLNGDDLETFLHYFRKYLA